MEIDGENPPVVGPMSMNEDGSFIATPTVTSGSRQGTMALQRSSDTENQCEVSIREDNVLVDQLSVVDTQSITSAQQELAVVSGYRRGENFKITINFLKETLATVTASGENGSKFLQVESTVLVTR